MKRALISLAPAVFLLASGCGPSDTAAPQSTTPAPQSSSAAGASSGTAGAATAPGDPKPAADGPCPYLDTEFVAEANGQHVSSVKVSADKPHPACFFYRPDGNLQLTVQVYVGEPATAKALVDKSAPIKTSNPATAPTGWNGGSLAMDDGAVYAVAKGGDAVVVTTNQQQTIKARRIATQAIEQLGL